MQEIVEGLQNQSPEEELCYQIATTNWGSNPTNVVVSAYVGYNNITESVFPTNSPSVDGDVITLSPLKNLTQGITYKIDVKFEVGSNVFECYFRVVAV